ncbi:hypothetical protein B0H13DRAFT_2497674 [Mycena leptocephala]|nr:hypothetical protein B0H13DRAFT_2497674 [Mycena leptocephala]
MARGSQIRGKTIEAFRSLFASHYGFERSVFAKTIAANKDTTKCSGYAENKIISSVRQLTIFRQRDSVGAVLPSYFNPIPLALIALEITALEFCTAECRPEPFQFKPLITPLSAVHPSSSRTQPTTRVADVERWNDYNTTVVENLRRTWYRRASQTLTSPIRLTASTNIDQEQEDALRDELAGRTIETV